MSLLQLSINGTSKNNLRGLFPEFLLHLSSNKGFLIVYRLYLPSAAAVLPWFYLAMHEFFRFPHVIWLAVRSLAEGDDVAIWIFSFHCGQIVCTAFTSTTTALTPYALYLLITYHTHPLTSFDFWVWFLSTAAVWELISRLFGRQPHLISGQRTDGEF